VLDVVIAIAAVASAFVAMSFFVSGVRAALSGHHAHIQNMRISRPGLFPAIKGEMNDDVASDEARVNCGMALDLKSKELIPQRKLSDEALEEVFGLKH
jgi:hypothetical protein